MVEEHIVSSMLCDDSPKSTHSRTPTYERHMPTPNQIQAQTNQATVMDETRPER